MPELSPEAQDLMIVIIVGIAAVIGYLIGRVERYATKVEKEEL